MSKSSAFRALRHALAGSAAALLLGAFALANPAGAVVLCPTTGVVGGFGYTSGTSSEPAGSTCSTAVTISLTDSQDEGKLQFGSSTPGFPSLTLGSFASGAVGGVSASADVSFSSAGSDEPYFILAFTDTGDDLGQGTTDQILFIEFEPNALSGNTLALDPNATLFNLYNNTTGKYFYGTGQSDVETLAEWLTLFPSLNDETLQGLWIGEGLSGSNEGMESMTINSVDVVPEPASVALFGAALAGIGFVRRKRAKTA